MRPRDRFDPPVLRCDFTIEASLDREALLSELAARSAWEGWRLASVLAHGGLHLDGRRTFRDRLPERIPAGTRITAYAFAWEPESVPVSPDQVLLERAGVLAVNKPAWLTVQASRASAGLSLEAALRAMTGAPALVAAHRLDRQTSGVTLFARDAGAASRLGRAFRERRVRRRYLALVAPPPEAEHWEVEGWLGRTPHPRRFRFALEPAPGPGRRHSHTRFRRLAGSGDRAIVACEPTTGRTHQIRVHLAAGGTPIVGDELYGAPPGVERLQLHAAELSLTDSEPLSVRAPLAPDLLPEFTAVAP